MTTRPTFYWHDYETWGRDPARDRPAQFAGLRTDMDLNPVGDPLLLFCRPTDDLLPDPEACLITGLTPQHAREQGVPEPEFIRRIHDELSRPGTCGVGYNSIRFDDEFTRYTLYRNFYDPYAREYQNGNSRWDIIDTVRLAAALRPEGMQWPRKDDGSLSFRLEDLTAANGIAHAGAHDALVDVQATIGLARRLRAAQPKLWDWVLANRSKDRIGAMLDPRQGKPVLHVSSRFGPQSCCMAMVLPLAWHPTNRNSVIVCDLSVDPQALLDLDAGAIRERLYSRREDLAAAGRERIPLKQVHINKAPVVVPVSLLDDAARARTGIDPLRCEQHRQVLLGARELAAKVKEVFSGADFPPATDPEAMLYSGFFSDRDRGVLRTLRESAPAGLAQQSFLFDDARLETLLFRYRARHAPQTLSAEEQQQWENWRLARLTDPAAGASQTLVPFLQCLARQKQQALPAGKRQVLQQLEAWAQGLVPASLWQNALQEAGQ